MANQPTVPARRVVSDSAELLLNSLTREDLDSFMRHALSKSVIQPKHLQMSSEFVHWKEKLDHFICLCWSPDGDGLAEIFLDWLLQENKKELHHKMVAGRSITPSSSSQSLMCTDSATRAAYGDDGSESDCESLSRNTDIRLTKLTKRRPSPEFVQGLMADTDLVYPITSTRRGVALILSNGKFLKLEKRNGHELDTYHLREVFTFLGYDVRLHTELTKEDFINVIVTETRENNADHRQYGSFVLCVLSRGDTKEIITADDKAVHISDLIDLVDNNNFPAMAGKPKFLFLDLCPVTLKDAHYDDGFKVPDRSALRTLATQPQQPYADIVTTQRRQAAPAKQTSIDELDVASKVDNVIIDHTKVPHKCDLVVCYSAFPYCSSFHNRQIGSVATRVLTEVLFKNAHNTHIADILFKVRRKLANFDFVSGKKQVCTTMDTLTKDFYMPPPPSD